MSPRFPRPTVSVRNILFKSFGGGRSPFYLTLPLLQRSNACIIAQTMSNCFSFSIFQCFFRCLLVDCRGSQFFFFATHLFAPHVFLLVFEFFTLFAYILHSVFRAGVRIFVMQRGLKALPFPQFFPIFPPI